MTRYCEMCGVAFASPYPDVFVANNYTYRLCDAHAALAWDRASEVAARELAEQAETAAAVDTFLRGNRPDGERSEG